MSPRDLTAEEIAELEKLRAEVDRLHGHFVDGGAKSMGVAQQLSYAEEVLGRAMCDKRASLLAMASCLLELEAARKWLKENEGTVMSFHGADEFIERAKRYGFPGLNAKGGENG